MGVDEVLQLNLNELSNPVAFTLISKRHHEFSKDPYVRASYFLTRSGRIQALYWALGRGKLLNERVIDVSACSFPPSSWRSVPVMLSPWLYHGPPTWSHALPTTYTDLRHVRRSY